MKFGKYIEEVLKPFLLLLKCSCIFFLVFALLLSSCTKNRKVITSFYYWKTVYKTNKIESDYVHHFNAHKLYMRIMDIDMDPDLQFPAPVSPIVFKDKLPDTLQIVPIVFIVNDILKTLSKTQLTDLANKIIPYVNSKVNQAGKNTYNELQIDCDWTAATRDSYF